MKVIIKKIIPTGKRFIPKNLVGKTGIILCRVYHHNIEWIRVAFPAEKTFSQMCFGNKYNDFLEQELECIM